MVTFTVHRPYRETWATYGPQLGTHFCPRLFPWCTIDERPLPMLLAKPLMACGNTSRSTNPSRLSRKLPSALTSSSAKSDRSVRVKKNTSWRHQSFLFWGSLLQDKQLRIIFLHTLYTIKSLQSFSVHNESGLGFESRLLFVFYENSIINLTEARIT